MVDHDVIIIGGGPAGLCAGLYASRGNLDVVLFDKGPVGGELLNTDLIDNYIGFEEIKGVDLAEKFKHHAEKFGLKIKTEEVLEIIPGDTDHLVKTRNGEYKTHAVIISAGGEPIKLGVPGEKELGGKGVSYCAVCDGFFFRNQVITVVGGGNAACEEGIFLTQYGSKVYIVHRRDKFRADKVIQKRLFANPKMEVIWDTVVESVEGTDQVEKLILKNVKTGAVKEHPTEGVFIFIGFTPHSALLKADVPKDGGGHYMTNERMEVGIPGIYAIGDVRSQLVKQITNAVGDGTTAAVAAEKYIESLKDTG